MWEVGDLMQQWEDLHAAGDQRTRSAVQPIRRHPSYITVTPTP